MYLVLDYIEEEDGVSICRCYGYEDILILPDHINGKPVTALYAYVLSGSAPADAPENVRRVILGEEEQGFGEERELSGEFLKEVYLPKYLKRIGGYAFYLCRNLHTLHVQSNLTDLGGGAFVWCRSLRKLCFSGVDWENDSVYGVLSELTQELDVEIEFHDGTRVSLTFPEYYEESVENTPARIIAVEWHGSGYKYRQCFPNTRLNLRLYDGLFPYAVANEFVPTCTKIAINRLSTPEQLSDEAKTAYLNFLGNHVTEIMKNAVREEDLETIELLAAEQLLTREETVSALELASEKCSAEIGSFLMDYRRTHFGTRHKTYEL